MDVTEPNELLMEFFTGLSDVLHYRGELGDYYYEIEADDYRSDCIEIENRSRFSCKVSIYTNFVKVTHWTEQGLRYYDLARYDSEEQRFQQSLEKDVLSTECEFAMKKAVKGIFLYIRDGMALYDPELYTE